MTQEQFLSWLKTTMGLIAGIAGSYGVGNANIWAMISAIVIGIAPYVWGYIANTKLAQIQKAAALPEVSSVVIKPLATNGIAAAAADPTQPKIVKQ
jgi:hypothetical protein